MWNFFAKICDRNESDFSNTFRRQSSVNFIKDVVDVSAIPILFVRFYRQICWRKTFAGTIDSWSEIRNRDGIEF